MIIRDASPSDLPALLRIEQSSFGEQVAFSRRIVRRMLVGGRALVRIAEDGPEPLGWSIGLIRRHAQGRTGRIYNVVVDPQHRGRGIGRALVVDLMRELTSRGVGRIYLEVAGSNAAAVGLYESLGFAAVRTLPDYYAAGEHGLSMRWDRAAKDRENAFHA